MSRFGMVMKNPKLARVAQGAKLDFVPLQVLVPVVSTVIALGIGLLIIAATGASVAEAVEAFWDGMAGSDFNIGASINRAISLALVGLGFIFSSRANLTNVGGEGPIAMGGIFAAAAGLPCGRRRPLGHALYV